MIRGRKKNFECQGQKNGGSIGKLDKNTQEGLRRVR